MIELRPVAKACDPDDILREPAGDAWRLYWLGQAGFLLQYRDTRILIDPYLSDSLAAKYASGEFPHSRLTPVPIDPSAMPPIDYVLCTHSHADHMDPGTLPALAGASPACRFVVPRAELGKALECGVPEDRAVPVTTDERVELGGGVVLEAVPAAHPDLRLDANGDYHCLGYVLSGGETCLYHSGDSIGYDGLVSRLKTRRIDLALLPVNGRDPYLESRGIIGNFTFEESAALCRAAGISALIPHHFGMFAENTIDENELYAKVGELDGRPTCAKPVVGMGIEAVRTG